VPDASRVAVIDLGSNSFRLVVFSSIAGQWWRRSDEIYESVRIGAGEGETGALQPAPMERALHTIEAYAHFCRASGLVLDEVQAVATSAIRDASNREQFLSRVFEVSGLPVRVLSREEEARYGYLAAVNSTTLADGAMLDLGGGSVQLVGVEDRAARELGSWPLGAVRMTEQFLPGEGAATKKQLKALRTHVRDTLAEGAGWLGASGDRLVGIGGAVRNLAAAAQRRAELPSFGVQGFVLERETLAKMIAELAEMTTADRARVPGIKPERGDLILAGATVVEAVLEAGGFATLEVTEAGLREGIFFEHYLAPDELFADVREASVRNLAHQYPIDPPHVEHVAALALQMHDALVEQGVLDRDAAERELLWAAAELHDIGMTVDYDDHHKHSRYLILNAALPGFTPREVALIAQMARYHRKGSPGFGELAPLMRAGDDELLVRGSALLRLAEQLERSRDQLVREARVAVDESRLRLELVHDGDVSVAAWAAERQGELVQQAFGRELEIQA
jgi:exopolyphosphatase / guanosine-5'-triphosphate,3'-diphosphate pyrophosphatase